MSRPIKHLWEKLTVLSTLSGLLYNSWPLGYWLNPVVARRGLGSELEGLHQPYNWLFVLGDVASSLLIAVAALWLWPVARRNPQRRLLGIALLNIGGFSLFTILDALLPLRCDPSIQSCPDFMHDPLLLTHGIFSIVAALCLFINLALIWWLDRHSRLLQAVLGGYVVFGLFSLIAIFTPGQSNWSQHYYLTLCAVWLALIPYGFWQVTRRKNLGP